MSEASPERPDLAVIDHAIELVLGYHGEGDFCCWALRYAAVGTLIAQPTEYERQFSDWVKHDEGKWPWWWSVDGGLHKRARVNRLKSFRRACIAAAQVQAPGATPGGAA